MNGKYTKAGFLQTIRHKGVIVACCVLVVLAAIYLALCGVGSGATIYPNVTVGGTSLGGLTLDEAQAVLEEAAQSSGEEQGIVFLAETAEGESVTVTVPLDLSPEDSAEAAFDVGHAQFVLARGAVYLRCLFGTKTVMPAYDSTEDLDTILTQALDPLATDPIEFNWEAEEDQLTITKGTPGNLVDYEAIRAEILACMTAGDLVDLTRADPQFTVELEQLLPEDPDFAEILAEVETPVQNAVVDIDQGIFQVEQQGLSFSVEEAEEVYAAMAWGETQSIELAVVEPETTLEDLSDLLYQDVLGTCTTTISGSSNRVKNVATAASYFTGTVLMPGETFSYNGVVGSRTTERGFVAAPAYVGGATVQEIGGGVCQGSSTIYLAALRANLEIVERYPHSYITTYVPYGMDATVYYGVKDFQFKNDTDFPIMVVGTVSGTSLTVSILGTKTDNLSVEMTYEIVSTTPYSTIYQEDASLAPGVTQVSVTPYTGYTIKVYRNIYENGVLLETRLETTSVYKSRDQVILIGPSATDTTTETTTETTTDTAMGTVTTEETHETADET